MRDYLSTTDSNSIARIIYSGPILDVPGGSHLPPLGILINSVDDAIFQTNSLIDRGAKVIKVYLEGGTSCDTIWPIMPLDQLRAVVETARSKSIPVAAHVQEVDVLTLALNAGVVDIAHPQLDKITPDSVVNRMINMDTYVCSSLSVYLVPENLQIAKLNIAKYHQSGVKIAFGTDYDDFWVKELGIPYNEIQLLLQCGLSPMDIIVAAPRNAAHVCGRDIDLGTIEEGKIADIIVVDGDPLADMRLLKTKLRMVIHNGRIVSND